MEIYINEKKREIKKNTTLFELKEEVKPNADIMIYNGFPVDKNKKLKENDSVVFIKKGKKP